ncbi:PQQ-dependent sugar dehydrogenase [Polymorphobacter sp.]|uniref:PQQ-dependent sugar dehydrogenase n=1 Tax=Polymorphobacter sp. TaxID=1909290 RepID=UPI003F6FCC39
MSATLLCVLAACDGGGGASSPTPVVPAPVNQSPSFTSATAASVVENATGGVYQAIATDPEGNALSYSISGGADAARFTMTAAGQLAFALAPNFDLPADSDGDNVYQVQIAVSDGNAMATLALAVTVTNSKEGIAVRRVATGYLNPAAMSVVSRTVVLVAEKAGAVYLFNPQTGARSLLVQLETYGDIGVVSVAASPRFATDGAFYAIYAGSGFFGERDGRLSITGYMRARSGFTVSRVPGATTVTLQQYGGGGWIAYEPDRTDDATLFALGDAGGIGDPANSAQDPTSRLGKLFRSVPVADFDPYEGTAPINTVLTSLGNGVRQPNGVSRFRNGFLFADRGENRDEINFFIPGDGANFGWPFKEGSVAVRGTPPAGLVSPVMEYPVRGAAGSMRGIVGGAMGPDTIASLRDHYVFADLDGTIFSVPAARIQPGTVLTAASLERRTQDFVPDQGAIDHPVAVSGSPDGILFILDADGDVFRVDAE